MIEVMEQEWTKTSDLLPESNRNLEAIYVYVAEGDPYKMVLVKKDSWFLQQDWYSDLLYPDTQQPPYAWRYTEG